MRYPVFLIVVLSTCFALVSCNAIPVMVGTKPVERTVQSVVIAQQQMSAEFTTATVTARVSQGRALILAAKYVPDATQATLTTARFGALTLRYPSGKVAYGVQNRPVWLVIYNGIAYAPSSSADSGCSCAQFFQRPSTVVALDARNGALVVVYGSG